MSDLQDSRSGEADEPLREGHELHLYVVEIVDQGVKVGVTAKPKNRIAQHRRDAQAFGREVGRVWLSSPHVEARSNELQLKRLAGPGQKREYLSIEYDAVLAVAKELPASRVTPEAIAKRDAGWEALMAWIFKGTPA